MTLNDQLRRVVATILFLCSACGGGGGSSDSSDQSLSAADVTKGGLVLTFGTTSTNPAASDAVASRASALLAEKGIAGVAITSQVQCPQGATLDGTTKACYDARILLPYIPERNLSALTELASSQGLRQMISADPTVGRNVSFVSNRGLAWGDDAAMLFSLRKMLDVSPSSQGAQQASAAAVSSAELEIDSEERSGTLQSSVSTSSTVTTLETVTIDTLGWTDSIKVVAKDTGYEHRVFAPGFAGVNGSSGTWVLYGLGALAKNNDIKCLQGKFRNLTNGATTTVTSGDCTSTEQYVTLSSSQVAVGVQIKISDSDVKGLGLAYGTPDYTVDAVLPDFLTGVSSTAYKFSGTSDGTYVPSSSSLTASYPYVVVGVEAKASDNLGGVTVYFGRLTAPEPGVDDLWQQHSVDKIESALVSGLNTIYDTVAKSLEFEAVPDKYLPCVSTIPVIEFCGSMAASATYSSSELDSACSGTCNVVYDTCKVSKEACKVACCYYCDPFPKTCSCNYDCDDEKDACYNGCTSTVTGSAEVDVKKVTELENLTFTDASIPFVTEGSSLGVNVSLEIKSGLTAQVYWKLCQSGVCASDTSPMQNSAMQATATGVLTAKACSSGAPALYLTIDNVEITNPGVWGIDDFVDDVVGVVQSSIDWLAENIDDLFYYNLQDEYDSNMNSTMSAIEGELNSVLVNTPIIPCS